MSMYRAADFYNQHPEIESRQHYMECLKRNYDQILEKGAAQNPLPEKESGKRGRVKRGRIRALIDRLRIYREKSAVLQIIPSYPLQTIRPSAICVWSE